MTTFFYMLLKTITDLKSKQVFCSIGMCVSFLFRNRLIYGHYSPVLVTPRLYEHATLGFFTMTG